MAPLHSIIYKVYLSKEGHVLRSRGQDRNTSISRRHSSAPKTGQGEPKPGQGASCRLS